MSGCQGAARCDWKLRRDAVFSRSTSVKRKLPPDASTTAAAGPQGVSLTITGICCGGHGVLHESVPPRRQEENLFTHRHSMTSGDDAKSSLKRYCALTLTQRLKRPRRRGLVGWEWFQTGVQRQHIKADIVHRKIRR